MPLPDWPACSARRRTIRWCRPPVQVSVETDGPVPEIARKPPHRGDNKLLSYSIRRALDDVPPDPTGATALSAHLGSVRSPREGFESARPSGQSTLPQTNPHGSKKLK